MIALDGVSARGAAERGRSRPVLTNVSLRASRGLLAIIGAHRDGTSLLFDLVDGTVAPANGAVTVLGGAPDAARARVARVSLDAPLPEALRVDEVCALAADIRGEPRRPAEERLALLGAGALARRRVATLAVDERRTVALALALGSSAAEVLLVEEPLVALDPVAPARTIEALRARASTATVVVTTASPRDATRLGDELALLSGGVYTPLAPDVAYVDLGGSKTVTVRVVLAAGQGKERAARLVAALGEEAAVERVETGAYGGQPGLVVSVVGRALDAVAAAITRAVAVTGTDVELVAPSPLPGDAIRAALAARAASPPPGSLPPSSLARPEADA